MTSSWGKILKLSVFGQSHGPYIGMVLDGLPAGLPVDMERLKAFMRRRAPGKAAWASPRAEDDTPQILSGVENGLSCGAPLAAIIKNKNAIGTDYHDLTKIPRPGHADFTAQARYGPRVDLRGGGHFSGRLTAPLTLAGGICLQILESLGIYIGAHIYSVGDIQDTPFDPVTITKEQLLLPGSRDFPVNDQEAGAKMQELILAVKEDGDSVGGGVECAVLGLPAGLGNPMFEGLENRLAQALFAIPAVKGLEFGAGFAAAAMRGSQHNDAFLVKNGRIRTKTNHHGGILGGISSGMPLIFKVAIKPTPSIAREQQSVDLTKLTPAALRMEGRHDPCIAPRAAPCVEAVTALVLLDIMLEHERTV